MSRALGYLSIAKKAGMLETGEENSGIEIRAGKAKLLVLASDASENALRRATGFVSETNVPLLRVPFSKEEISSSVGKNGCSMLVFRDIGLAFSFASALAGEYGEEYTPLADEMRRRSEKSAQRKKEARAHERNKKLGKRRNNV